MYHLSQNICVYLVDYLKLMLATRDSPLTFLVLNGPKEVCFLSHISNGFLASILKNLGVTNKILSLREKLSNLLCVYKEHEKT